MLAVVGPPEPASAEDCEAWPGEFSPLPTVDSPDPFAAQWAALRVRELSGLAEELEATDRLESHRLWRRILCLTPEDAAALAAVARTEPRVVVRQPTVPQPSEPTLEALDRAVTRAQELIFDARFRDALKAVDEARESTNAAPSAAARQRLASLEVIAATAWVALRKTDEANASFERALAQNPGLELDAGTTPPKVRRAFQAARSSLARRDG